MKLSQLIKEAEHISTIANVESFVKDVAKAFNQTKDTTLDITVTLKGSNVLEYSIKKRQK